MKNISLRKLVHAQTLAQTGSYARASEQLHLTQSALTRSIQALEAELGVVLFERARSGVRLTVDGRTILEKSRFLLAQARTLEREIALLKNVDSGQISFGVGPAIPSIFLPQLMTGLYQQHPGLKIDVVIEPGYRLLELLSRESIEFFVADVQSLQLDQRLYMAEPLQKIPVGFYVRVDHPLAGERTIDVESIRRFPVVAPQYRADSGRDELGLQDSVQLLCNDLPTLKQMALQTDAILLAIEPMVADEVAAGSLVLLAFQARDHAMMCDMAIVSLLGRSPSMAATTVIGQLRGLLPG